MSSPPSPARRLPVGPLVAALAVATVALMLRPAATSLGPLLPEISDDLGGGGIGAGVLTALPPFIFGVLGLAAVPIGRRLGLSGAIVAALAVFVTLLGAIRLFVFPAESVVAPLLLGLLFALVNAAWLVCAFNPGLATTFVRRDAGPRRPA